jgi:subfamily B ATP-binding cassette protein MsbA
MVPILSEAVRFINVRAIMYMAHRVIADIRLAMYDRILQQSLRYHGEHSSGTTVSKLMDDVNMVLRLFTGETLNMFVDVIVLLVALAIAFSISPKLSLVLCLVLIFYAIAYRIFAGRIRAATESYRKVYDVIAGRLQETVAGVRQVRIYNREQWEDQIFRSRVAESSERALATSMGSVNLGTACSAISGFGSTIIYGMAAYMVLRENLTYGDMLAFNAYVWMTMNPVVRLTNMAGQLVSSMVSVERIVDVLEAKNEITSPPNAPPLPAGGGQVDLENVWFGYETDKPLYQGLNLHVEPGSTVALVGPTGCGKTSLVSLLMRYWDIGEGRILIDGADVREVDLPSLRSVFGVVLQDPVVFDGTLARNIAYGRPDATREEIENAAKAAEIYNMAMALPDGFDTVIGKKGVKLSVGEKQRVSIARAILKNPRIMIMDEATSSLDSQSEILIQRALANVLKNRTSFVVAHRLSTIVSADQIVVMSAGQIVQQGRHEELLAADGLYRRLYDQLRGQGPAGGGEA